MKKYSHIIILALSLVVCSCSYEYEMPDYSNAVTRYDKTQLESGIENKIREAYSKYDVEAVNIDIQEEHAIEKDISGSIIYDGNARGRANIRSKTLELSYAVNHRIRLGGGHYQPVVTYYQRSFDIDVSPFEVKASVTNEKLQIPFYLYWVTKQSFNNTIFDKVDELSYELADAKIYVTELDKEKKDLLRYELEDPYGKPFQPPVLSQIGAEYIFVEIEIYRWPKDDYRVYYDKRRKIGTFVFNNEYRLFDINNSTLELTSDMQYTFIEEPELSTFYNVKNSLPMINKANELGFEFSSWMMYISEKDSDGNVLTRFEHESKDGKIEAQDGAKTIDVEVEIYGWPKENGRVNYNKKQKIGTFVIKDIPLSEINNTTLELTDNMQYEFVR